MDLIATQAVKHFSRNVFGDVLNIIRALIEDVPRVESEVHRGLKKPAQRLLLDSLDLLNFQLSRIAQMVHLSYPRYRLACL